MKKILCLIDSLGAGGAQRQMVGLASLLKENGYYVSVVFYHKDLFYAESLQVASVPFFYLKKAERKVARLYHIARFIRRTQPDAVVSYLDTPCICSCFARFFNRKFKLIVSERNTSQRTGTSEIIRFNLFRIASFVVPNSFSQEAYITRQFPFLANKTVTIPNYVDLDYFVPPLMRTKRVAPEVVVVASIWASKNTLGFIDAVVELKKKGFKFHVSWYGLNSMWGDYIRQCNQKIIDNDLTEYIELKEKTTQIRDVYYNADFYCLPSFYEGTPNVICEAIACGLPGVCSNVCDNSRYVINGENGFLFDPQDTSSIVTSFVQLFALNNAEYNSFCRMSRSIAEQKLTKTVFIQKYLSLIEQ